MELNSDPKLHCKIAKFLVQRMTHFLKSSSIIDIAVQSSSYWICTHALSNQWTDRTRKEGSGFFSESLNGDVRTPGVSEDIVDFTMTSHKTNNQCKGKYSTP